MAGRDDGGRGEDMSAVLNLGFRIFFLGAGVYAVLAMGQWAALYAFGIAVPLSGLTPFQWHAHGMIYGYALAVIAGFLLTAAKNWTGLQTLHGRGLLALFLAWAAARGLWCAGDRFALWAGLLDLAFMAGLVVAVAAPVIRVKQWRQMAILGKVLLLAIFNALFYLGVLGVVDNGVHWGVYGGVFLVLALILTVSRRVAPMFIERGVGYPVTLYNARWIDLSSLVLFLLFFIVVVFTARPAAAAVLAGLLFIVTTVRLAGWHTPGIWKKPLLWSLYVALAFIDLGFLLYALVPVAGIPPFAALHAFTVGGIGLVTLSMMSRVSLGHTGRDVHAPPRAVGAACAILVGCAAVRVAGPLVDGAHYTAWILASQVLWLAAFLVFLAVFGPLLTAPRADGQPG